LLTSRKNRDDGRLEAARPRIAAKWSARDQDRCPDPPRTLLAIDGAARFDYVSFRVHRFAILLLALIVGTATLAASTRASSAPWKNCTQVNKRYAHGVGKVGARDKTSGPPVRNFKHSNRLYSLAMTNNRGLDRDHDGIACEKA